VMEERKKNSKTVKGKKKRRQILWELKPLALVKRRTVCSTTTPFLVYLHSSETLPLNWVLQKTVRHRIIYNAFAGWMYALCYVCIMKLSQLLLQVPFMDRNITIATSWVWYWSFSFFFLGIKAPRWLHD
jgi:hypothetical protein